jgi:hypothetical protein
VLQNSCSPTIAQTGQFRGFCCRWARREPEPGESETIGLDGANLTIAAWPNPE